jgi:serine/threonine protein kinase
LEFIGDYELVEKIAEGGMGAVYKARHRDSADLVAIKVLPPHLARNPVLLKRFEQEYIAASTLDHPNIVRALAFGHQGDSPYLVMEYVEGESLGERLDRDGALPEAEAIQIISQVAQGLQKAHREGMVHRDVKPDNILMTPAGIAKLADLGLVKELETDLNLTRTGRGLGTPHFMAPEQFRNAKYVDARSDIYSLAATLYMMVTGELPFKQLGPVEAWTQKVENKLTSPRELVPDLSERVDWAIRRAMRADPGQRPGSCREFIEDLTGHSTKPLLGEATTTGMEVWYLRFKDDDGVSHTVKETLISIRRSLKEGLLGDPNNIRASRSPSGPFELLKRLPEFRDVAIAAALNARKAEPARPAPAPRSIAPPTAPTPVHPLPNPGSGDARRLPNLPAPPSSLPTPLLRSPPRPPADLELTPAPHFDLGPAGTGVDWGRVLIFLVLAIVAGVAGFFLLPQLIR